MCRDYRSAYARIKEEHKVIDFDDMEHFALEILQAKGGRVADIYRENSLKSWWMNFRTAMMFKTSW